MGYLDLDSARVYNGGVGTDAAVIYVIDDSEHPFDLLALSTGRSFTLVSIPVLDWRRSLTPWPAAGIYREEPAFGGDAAATLDELSDALPAIENAAGLAPAARAICGYSLGGLFALYALTHASVFDACACLSGSVWYEGWVEHLGGLNIDLSGKFAYLSVGTKEKRAARPILRTVQANMETCAHLLEQRGCEVCYRTGPGNHMQRIPERLFAGLDAVETFFA